MVTVSDLILRIVVTQVGLIVWRLGGVMRGSTLLRRWCYMFMRSKARKVASKISETDGNDVREEEVRLEAAWTSNLLR